MKITPGRARQLVGYPRRLVHDQQPDPETGHRITPLEVGSHQDDEALSVCRQIAQALEAAHAEGIIHRDLKPANVIVTPDGTAKVLDFGIAKSTHVNVDLGETQNATHLTLTGTVTGTPAYMSPEQVRGEDIDERADVWAFGCLLYELVTGKLLFGRETLADTLAGILDYQPDWEQLPDDLPDGIRNLLERYLRKDRDRRPRHIADVTIEIDEALADVAGIAVPEGFRGPRG